MAKCPGQDTYYWKPDDIYDVPCPACGQSVEFFKTDPTRKCPGCGYTFANPKLDPGCAQWCPHAELCTGLKLVSEGQEGGGPGTVRLVDRLLEALRNHLGRDREQMVHTLSVVQQAQELLPEEEADSRTVLAAAVLHDVGAECIHHEGEGEGESAEGKPLGCSIMQELGLDEETVAEVCRISENYLSGRVDSPEAAVLSDAHALVQMAEKQPEVEPGEVEAFVKRLLRTEAGRKKGRELLSAGTPA